MMSSRITLSVDTSVGAAYIKLSDEPIVETIEAAPDIQVDIDVTGTVAGVEVLNLAAAIPLDALVGKFHFAAPEDVLAISQIGLSIRSFVPLVSYTSSGQAYMPALQPI